MLRATQERWLSQQDKPEEERVPVRGSNRLDGARLAIAPLADTLPPDQFERLTMAIMLVYGLEAMVVTRDACGLDEPAAADLMSWAARSLVRAALTEP